MTYVWEDDLLDHCENGLTGEVDLKAKKDPKGKVITANKQHALVKFCVDGVYFAMPPPRGWDLDRIAEADASSAARRDEIRAGNNASALSDFKESAKQGMTSSFSDELCPNPDGMMPAGLKDGMAAYNEAQEAASIGKQAAGLLRSKSRTASSDSGN